MLWQIRSLRRANTAESSPGSVTGEEGKDSAGYSPTCEASLLAFSQQEVLPLLKTKEEKYCQLSDLLGIVTKPLNMARGTFV